MAGGRKGVESECTTAGAVRYIGHSGILQAEFWVVYTPSTRHDQAGVFKCIYFVF